MKYVTHSPRCVLFHDSEDHVALPTNAARLEGKKSFQHCVHEDLSLSECGVKLVQATLVSAIQLNN